MRLVRRCDWAPQSFGDVGGTHHTLSHDATFKGPRPCGDRADWSKRVPYLTPTDPEIACSAVPSCATHGPGKGHLAGPRDNVLCLGEFHPSMLNLVTPTSLGPSLAKSLATA